MSNFGPWPETSRFIKKTVYAAVETRDSPWEPEQEVSGQPDWALQEDQFDNWQLSGLFTIPASDLPLTMFLYVSSQIDAPEEVQLQVNRFDGESKITIFQTAAVVPAQGAVQVQFDVTGLGLMGQTVEVLLRSAEQLNIFQLFPSVNVVQTFPADGATLPLLFVSPAYFFQVFPVADSAALVSQSQGTGHEPPPPILLTTGVFEVPQGTFGVRPRVVTVLSNFFDQPLGAEVIVNTLVRGTTRKENVLTEMLVVPPGGFRKVAIDDVEGLPTEINYSLGRTERGDTLQTSANVLREISEIELVLFIPAGGFMGIFPETQPASSATPGSSTALGRTRNKGGDR